MRWLAMIFYLLMLLMASAALQELDPPGGAPTIWMLIALLSFLSVLVHEIGHAVAATRIGARVIVLVALPFELRFSPNRIGLAPRRPHRDIGGYVRYEPLPGQTRQTSRQAMLVAAWGPLANFALAFAALLLGTGAAALFGTSGAPAAMGSAGGMMPSDAEIVASLRHAPWLRAAEASRLIAAALALISTGMGVANLIPFSGSDGAEILRAWRSLRAT